jgi:hypothetical protein
MDLSGVRTTKDDRPLRRDERPLRETKGLHHNGTNDTKVAKEGSRRVGWAKGMVGLDWHEAGFDLLTLGLKEGRQGQLFAEGFQGLVHAEAGLVGGELEQDAVGDAEVH